MTVKQKISSLSAALILLLAVLGFLQFRSVAAVDHVWHHFQNNAQRKQELLTEIKSQFGYGGFIHNFKNHVLRGTQKYVERFRENEKLMKKAIADYRKLPMTSAEQQALARIEEVADRYSRAIGTSVRMHAGGSTPAEIDKVVKIDDSPAFAGFRTLTNEVRTIRKACSAGIRGAVSRMHTLLLVTGLALALFFTFFFTILFQVGRRLQAVHAMAEKVGSGDLTAAARIKGRDEIALIASSMEKMTTAIREMVTRLVRNAENLQDSSAQLSRTAEDTDSRVSEVAERSNTVAVAAEEMSANMNNVATTVDQASDSVTNIARSMEEITNNIQGISKNGSEAKQITERAVEQALEASDKVNNLGDAAEKIGKVTETIIEISEQTNLLALNATIEAARAGEAGKGFAVVANEIKELASQTSNASIDIKDSVSRIQESTDETVRQITDITDIISRTSEIVYRITAAVEEQHGTTREIARSVNETQEGIVEMGENIGQSSAVANEVASDIARVNRSASDLSDNSRQVRDNAAQLRGLADELRQLVSGFTI